MSAARQVVVGLSDLIKCCVCGIVFAFDAEQEKRRRNDGRLFWCPNGHDQAYTDTEAKRLRRELEEQKAATERANKRTEWARKEAKSEKKRHAATKGQLTKTRKRVGAGVCPCCNRSFQQLAKHMAHKHPEYGTVGS